MKRKFTPPLPGGEATFHIDTGPQPVRPGVKTVNLIPVGDGGPGPLLPRTRRRKSPKTSLPSDQEVATLPRWVRVAFAARCARRAATTLGDAADGLAADVAGGVAAQPPRFDFTAPGWVTYRGTGIPRVVGAGRWTAAGEAFAAAYAATEDVTRQAEWLAKAADALARGATHADNPDIVAVTGVDARDYQTQAARAGELRSDLRAVSSAVSAAAAQLLRTSTDPTVVVTIRKDFDRVNRLVRANGWTDDTPVPPDVFGPLWPPGREPRWTRR